MSTRRIVGLLIPLASVLLSMQAAYASVSVLVEDACSDKNLAQNDFTAHAIVPPDGAAECEIRWSSRENPVTRGTQADLYFGQPGEVVELAKESIAFEPDGARGFSAVRRFSMHELGSQSFVTVLVTKSGEILQWTAWTVRKTKLPEVPAPASNLSVDLRLTALHLENARGHFPRSRQAEGVVWKAAGEEDVGYELDGADTGSPGLHVTVSNAWTPEDLSRLSVREALEARVRQAAGISSHVVRFGELKWIETLPESILYQDGTSEFQRKHFYTIVTIWTDASYRPVGSRNPQRYVHETSARAWPAKEVTEWASYARSEYTQDPRLLALIRDYTVGNKAIPGFSRPPQPQGGDAGSSTFSLRFLARLRPWAPDGIHPADDPRFAAGIESFAVVGTRVGVGTATVVQESDDRNALCSAFELFCPDDHPATMELPKGWYREPASAHLTMSEGSVPIVQASPQLAVDYTSRGPLTEDLLARLSAQYRGVMDGPLDFRTRASTTVLGDESGNAVALGSQLPVLTLAQLPSSAYFVLGAKLGAGALIRKDGIFFHSYRMIPVNSYVQYVIRTTAIKDRAALLTSAPIRELADPLDFGVDQRPGVEPSFFAGLWNAFTSLPGFMRMVIVVLVAAAVLALMWFVAPLRPIVAGLGKVVGALLNAIGSLLRKVVRSPARPQKPQQDP